MDSIKVFEHCWENPLHMIEFILKNCKAILMAVCYFYVFSLLIDLPSYVCTLNHREHDCL